MATSGDVDLSKIGSVYATKQQPDNVLPRLEALEKAISAATTDDLTKRLSLAEETLNKSHEPRIKALQTDFANLKASLSGMNTTSNSTTVDTSQILMRLNFINDELSKKADKSELQQGVSRLHSEIDSGLERCNKDWQAAIA